MEIVITKDTEDPRENRGSLKKGMELTVEDCATWRDLIKAKKAKEKTPLVSKVVLKNVEEAENFNDKSE